jgi:hypothetical protein
VALVAVAPVAAPAEAEELLDAAAAPASEPDPLPQVLSSVGSRSPARLRAKDNESDGRGARKLNKGGTRRTRGVDVADDLLELLRHLREPLTQTMRRRAQHLGFIRADNIRLRRFTSLLVRTARLRSNESQRSTFL